MYEHIHGTLVGAPPGRAVVDCGGVGYVMRVPVATSESLPKPGSKVKLLTHLHVREDAMELFGFATEGERAVFRKLIGVSGVGPASAMALMSQCPVTDVVLAIRCGEPKHLTRAKGIGRRIAERIILELKGHADALEALLGVKVGPRAAASDPAATTRQALVSLGYGEDEAEAAAREAVAAHAGADAGELLREALKRLARG